MEQNVYERFFSDDVRIRYFQTANGKEIAVLNYLDEHGFPWSDEIIQEILDSNDIDTETYHLALFKTKGGLRSKIVMQVKIEGYIEKTLCKIKNGQILPL